MSIFLTIFSPNLTAHAGESSRYLTHSIESYISFMIENTNKNNQNRHSEVKNDMENLHDQLNSLMNMFRQYRNDRTTRNFSSVMKQTQNVQEALSDFQDEVLDQRVDELKDLRRHGIDWEETSNFDNKFGNPLRLTSRNIVRMSEQFSRVFGRIQSYIVTDLRMELSRDHPAAWLQTRERFLDQSFQDYKSDLIHLDTPDSVQNLSANLYKNVIQQMDKLVSNNTDTFPLTRRDLGARLRLQGHTLIYLAESNSTNRDVLTTLNNIVNQLTPGLRSSGDFEALK